MNNQANFTLKGLLVALVALAVTLAESSAFNILDDAPIKSVADTICESNGDSSWQIARMETIDKLVEYFGGLSEGDKLYTCVELFTLKELQRVIKIENDDVCSGKKIDAIEEFHNKYVSKWSKDSSDRKLWGWKAPKLIVEFFIHYAYQVSVVCKASLLERLSSVRIGEMKPEVLEVMDKEIKEFFSRNGSGAPNDINGVTLAWRWAERGPQRESFTTPTASNGYTRATFATSESRKRKRIQFECRFVLKPIYGGTLLSIIRLIDMGYYLKYELFASELANNPTLRRLVGTVLICETVLPVRIVQDDSVKPGQMNLIRSSEGQMYYAGTDLILNAIVPTRWQVSLKDLKTLPTVTKYDREQIFKSLKKNIRKHESSFSRVLAAFSDVFKTFVGKIFSCSSQTKEGFNPGDAALLFSSIA